MIDQASADTIDPPGGGSSGRSTTRRPAPRRDRRRRRCRRGGSRPRAAAPTGRRWPAPAPTPRRRRAPRIGSADRPASRRAATAPAASIGPSSGWATVSEMARPRGRSPGLGGGPSSLTASRAVASAWPKATGTSTRISPSLTLASATSSWRVGDLVDQPLAQRLDLGLRLRLAGQRGEQPAQVAIAVRPGSVGRAAARPAPAPRAPRRRRRRRRADRAARPTSGAASRDSGSGRSRASSRSRGETPAGSPAPVRALRGARQHVQLGRGERRRRRRLLLRLADRGQRVGALRERDRRRLDVQLDHGADAADDDRQHLAGPHRQRGRRDQPLAADVEDGAALAEHLDDLGEQLLARPERQVAAAAGRALPGGRQARLHRADRRHAGHFHGPILSTMPRHARCRRPAAHLPRLRVTLASPPADTTLGTGVTLDTRHADRRGDRQAGRLRRPDDPRRRRRHRRLRAHGLLDDAGASRRRPARSRRRCA